MICKKCDNFILIEYEKEINGRSSKRYSKCFYFGDMKNEEILPTDNTIIKCSKFEQKQEINKEFVKLKENHFLFKNKENATSFAKKNIEPKSDIKIKLSDLFIHVQSRKINLLRKGVTINPSYYVKTLELLEKLENRIRVARKYKDKKQKEDKETRLDSFIMDLSKNKYFLKHSKLLKESTAIADVLKSISKKSKKEIPWSRGKFLLSKYLKGCRGQREFVPGEENHALFYSHNKKLIQTGETKDLYMIGSIYFRRKTNAISAYKNCPYNLKKYFYPKNFYPKHFQEIEYTEEKSNILKTSHEWQKTFGPYVKIIAPRGYEYTKKMFVDKISVHEWKRRIINSTTGIFPIDSIEWKLFNEKINEYGKKVSKLTFDDFKAINFGVVEAEANGHVFVYNSSRENHDGCVLFIDKKEHQVEGFDQALEIINKFISEQDYKNG